MLPTSGAHAIILQSECRESGGIGRRTRFRFWRRKAWGFESLLSHHGADGTTGVVGRDVIGITQEQENASQSGNIERARAQAQRLAPDGGYRQRSREPAETPFAHGARARLPARQGALQGGGAAIRRASAAGSAGRRHAAQLRG